MMITMEEATIIKTTMTIMVMMTIMIAAETTLDGEDDSGDNPGNWMITKCLNN